MQITVVKNTTKEYPDMFKVVVYRQPRTFVRTDRVKRNREEVDEKEYKPCYSSLRRTKSLVRDIIICNDFRLFCTFTFNPKKVDSFKFSSCRRAMSIWLHNQYNRSREQGIRFKYIIIPERHKSGRWHFHALISGYIGSLKPSGQVTPYLRPIYNITSFRSGFTTAVEIDDSQAVADYVTKYITKDLIQEFNRRRFFASRNLIKPTKMINSKVFSFTLPLFRRHVASNPSSDEYVIDKYPDLSYNESNEFRGLNVAQYRDPDNSDYNLIH